MNVIIILIGMTVLMVTNSTVVISSKVKRKEVWM